MKKLFKNAFTYIMPAGEVNTEPSKTRPEMTLSLKELLNRYTRGGEVATFTPVYYGNGEFDDTPEFEKMDAIEKLSMAKKIREDIQKYQNRPDSSKTEPTQPPVELAKPDGDQAEPAPETPAPDKQ